jgi:prophage regulatory protein
MKATLIRLSDVLNVTGQKRSTHYRRISEGFMTPPVKLGARCAAWPTDEVEAINAARISGKSDVEIRDLVANVPRQQLSFRGQGHRIYIRCPCPFCEAL